MQLYLNGLFTLSTGFELDGLFSNRFRRFLFRVSLFQMEEYGFLLSGQVGFFPLIAARYSPRFMHECGICRYGKFSFW